MGEMADYALNEVFDEEEARSDYRRGAMSIEEAYEQGIVDELGFDMTAVVSRTCRYCGKTGLRWVLVKDKWRLFDGDSIHDCPINPLKKDEL